MAHFFLLETFARIEDLCRVEAMSESRSIAERPVIICWSFDRVPFFLIAPFQARS